MSAAERRTQAERDALKKVRRIHVTRRGRCRFCGQLTEGGHHTTLARLASGRSMCTGKPKAPYRISVSITKNGLRSDTYPLTGDEEVRYAKEIAQLVAEIKKKRVSRLTRVVPA